MPRQDRETITRLIRDRLDIVEVIGGYLTLRRAGTRYKGLCPFHQEKTPSFTVSPDRQIFKCFGCGAGGDVFTFVMMKENVDFLEARRMMGDRVGIDTEQDSGPSSGPKPAGKSELAKVNEWAQQIFRRQYESPAGQSAREYVTGRQISAECAADFGVGLTFEAGEGIIEQARKAGISTGLLLAAGLAKESQYGRPYDTFRERLMFPIRDATGRLVGFGGRTMVNDPAKYLNTPATALFDKSANLFGIEKARHAAREKGRMIVVEGYTDCMMAHQHGFAETVASLGTAMTESHAQLVRRYCDRVVLIFDSDEAGQKAADRAVSVTLTSGLDVVLARVPAGKDPCDYLPQAGAEAFEQLIRTGVGALEFKWRLVSRAFQASQSGPERRRAIEAYLAELAVWVGHGAVDPIQKGLLVNQLSTILALPAGDLIRQLDRQARRSVRPGPSAVASKAGGEAGNGPVAGAPASEPTSASQAGTTPRPGGRPIGQSGEQLALRQIMAVLLHEPEWYPNVARIFRPEAFRDQALATIARCLIESIESVELFRLDEFIGRLESPVLSAVVTDLHEEGSGYADRGEVIDGALDGLESCARAREIGQLGEAIRRERQQAGPSDAPVLPASEDERLSALAANARCGHFSPARVRQKFLKD